MDKFVSIAVNQGDAFYLERSGVKILVDGGRSRGGFGRQFVRTVGAEEVDVVVCTHADADHIDGLLGYFDEGLRAKEVWLPGVWTSRLSDLLENPENFVRELVGQVNEFEGDLPECLADLPMSSYSNEHDGIEVEGDSGRLEKIFGSIDKAVDASNNLRSIVTYELVDSLWLYGISPGVAKLVIESLHVAEKIRELATLAYHSGAKIRWFEFLDVGVAGGGESYLRPVNSKEIFGIKKHLGVLEYLYLSIENKRSLVFYSPATDQSGDVLFSADSDYSFSVGLPALGNDVVVTSPHHGSQSNARAYAVFEHIGISGDNAIFVRSDGRFMSRPGPAYMGLSAQKICTLCRHVNAVRQNITLYSEGGKWVVSKEVLKCYCDNPDLDYVNKARLAL